MGRFVTGQRILVIVLVFVMFAGMVPKPAAAEEDQLGSAVATFVLSNLASGALSYAGGVGMEAALGSIFGTPEDTTLIDGFNEIKEQIQNLEQEISRLSSKIDVASLKSELNDYGAFINNYSAVYDHLCRAQVDYADEPILTDIFLQKLYHMEDPNTMIDGKSLINATLTLGNRLTLGYVGRYNIFGAFDKMEKYINRWEHQGYADRQAFRNSSIFIYAMLSSMSQLACEAVIVANQGTDSVSMNQRAEANRWLNQLKDNVVKVDAMNKRCAVILHPDIRIYRDTKNGNDLWYFKTKVEASVSDNTTYPYYSNDIYGITDERYLYSMSRTTKMNREKFSNGFNLYSLNPSVNMYQTIYRDYKADNGGTAVDLYNIFFSKDMGAFTLPSGVANGAKFATHTYLWRESPYAAPRGTWNTQVINNQGQSENRLLVDVQFHPRSQNYGVYKIHTKLNEKFFGPHYYYGSVEQGRLMSPDTPPYTEPEDKISGMSDQYVLPHSEPVTLMVEAKAGYTCQWYVDTGDDQGYEKIEGATETSYSLPELQGSMNGYKYICAFIVPETGLPENHEPDSDPPEEVVLTTAAVTLHLSGEGVFCPEKIHEVSSAYELDAALDLVDAGDWDGHTLRLAGDIEYPMPITLINRSLQINLNRYTLTVSPSETVEPNVDPMGSSPELAAIFVSNNQGLTVADISNGALNVVCGSGVDYGVYTAEGGTAQVSTVMLTDGKSAVYASGVTSTIDVAGSVQVSGGLSAGARCVDGGVIRIEGDVTVEGEASCGVYVESSNGVDSTVEIDGGITVTGINSRGVYLDSADAKLVVKGSVTVNSGISGISARQGEVVIVGNVTAPNIAIKAWDGAEVNIAGNVTATGSGSTSVMTAVWELSDSVVGSTVTVDGSISAFTYLSICGVSMSKHDNVNTPGKPGYFTYTDGVNTVWVLKPSDSWVPSTPPTPADPPVPPNPTSEKFTDVDTHWGKESMEYVIEKGIFNGTSETTFSPDRAMQRGMLLIALSRLAGVDLTEYNTSSFVDVEPDSTVRPYIEWAYSKGIVQGVGNSMFAPDRDVTREEIAVIFANFAKATGFELPVIYEAVRYVDADNIGSGYKAAVSAMQQAGIMIGDPNNMFNPKAKVTRAEICTMFHRYIELTVKL